MGNPRRDAAVLGKGVTQQDKRVRTSATRETKSRGIEKKFQKVLDSPEKPCYNNYRKRGKENNLMKNERPIERLRRTWNCKRGWQFRPEEREAAWAAYKQSCRRNGTTIEEAINLLWRWG